MNGYVSLQDAMLVALGESQWQACTMHIYDNEETGRWVVIPEEESPLLDGPFALVCAVTHASQL